MKKLFVLGMVSATLCLFSACNNTTNMPKQLTKQTVGCPTALNLNAYRATGDMGVCEWLKAGSKIHVLQESKYGQPIAKVEIKGQGEFWIEKANTNL